MARNSGWVPQQHGAWAMLVVPSALGALARAQLAGRVTLPGSFALVATLFAGYFAFNAFSLWRKAPERRRPALRAPLLTYAALTAVLGVAAVALTTPFVLAWAAPTGLAGAAAVAAVLGRRERATGAGFATILVASLMLLVIAHPDPRRGLATVTCVLFLACFAYFAGTVLVVKTVIRERGERAMRVGSFAWHAVWTALLALWTSWQAPDARGLGLALTAFLGACAARAVAVPLVDAQHRLRPAVVGAIEVVFSLVLLAIGVAALLGRLSHPA